MKTRILCTVWGLLAYASLAIAGEAPGIKVGSKAPAATFIDQFGKKITLKDLTDKGPVALVFHRSARW